MQHSSAQQAVDDLKSEQFKRGGRRDLPIITVFDFEYEGVSESEAKFLVDIELGETVLSPSDIYTDVDSMLDGCDVLE